MTTQPQNVGPVFATHFAHRRDNPQCPVHIVYRTAIGIPQTKDAAGVWQIDMQVGRKTVAMNVAAGLAGLDAADKRPLVLDIEAPANPMLTRFCLDMAAWIFPGREIGQIGDWPAFSSGPLYPMAYTGRRPLPDDLLTKLDAAHKRRLVPLVWNKVASGKFSGLYVTDADTEATCRMLARWLVEVDGTGTVIGWSDAKTQTEERRFTTWFAKVEARTLKIVAEKQADMPGE